jgi:hypothetical protein
LEGLPKAQGIAHQHLRVAIFMATPNYAHLLDESSPFLASAMSTVFGHLEGWDSSKDTLTSIVGIVDKLPGEKGSFTQGAPTGKEGLAYLLTYPQNIETKAGTTSHPDRSPATVRFDLAPSSMLDVDFHNKRRSDVFGHAQIAIPLANTLFVNGQKSTLSEKSWTMASQAISSRGQPKQLSSLSILFPQSVKALLNHFPLDPILPDPASKTWSNRRVTSALGNVLRTVEVDGVHVPASKELEIAVAKQPLPTHKNGSRAKVYATVTPKDRSNLFTRPRPWNLLSGLGFYQVTGGGGGWGQKQGLLSLDPTRTYNDAEENILPSGEDEFRGENLADFLGSAKSIVQPDDHVAFWTEAIDENASFNFNTASANLRWDSADKMDEVMLLGVTRPSEQSGLVLGGARNNDNAIVHLERSFGLLSEKGLALEFNGHFKRKLEEKDPDEVDPDDAPAAKVHENQSATDGHKMTAPFLEQTEESVSQRTIVELPGAWVGTRCWSESFEKRAASFEKKLRNRNQHQKKYQRSESSSQADSKANSKQAEKQKEQQVQQRRPAKAKGSQPSRRADDVIIDTEVPLPDEPVHLQAEESGGSGVVGLDAFLGEEENGVPLRGVSSKHRTPRFRSLLRPLD